MVSVWQVAIIDGTSRIEEVRLAPEPSTLDEASLRLPSGAYTTLRTYFHNRVIRLASHRQRLEESAALKGNKIALDERLLRQAMQAVIDQYDKQVELRLRITLDLTNKPGELYLSAEALKTPSRESYESGVAVITCNLHRDNPQAKLTNFISPASEFRLALPAGVQEALMLDADGRILEGLSCNFFAVRQGRLFTAGEGILEGLTRTMVIEVAEKASYFIEYYAIPITEMGNFDEAFITSASRGILSVRSIDGVLLGDGFPGEVTRKLSKDFDLAIQNLLETVSE
jgi:branched-chain amino acid aminotransferase